MKTAITIAAAALFICCLCTPGVAQSNSGSRTRSVHGIVHDASGAPVRGAAVEMQDMRTKTIRSFLTGPKGRYHFDGLYSNVNYQLRIRYAGHLGPTADISRFSSRKDLTVNFRAP